MMTRNKKWLLAVSVATMIAANGIVMAAVAPEQKNETNGKRSAAFTGKDFQHKRNHKMDNTELLSLLKIDAQTFKNEMKAGKSLLTIAKEHGVSEQALKEFMIQKMTQRIEAGVKAGKLTAEQADKMKANMEERVSVMMNGEKAMQRGRMPRHRAFDNSAILKLLKIDQDTFRSEMKSGKSLVTIAKEHGVSEQTLKDTMVQQMKQRIEDGVKTGKISAEKAEQMKTNMEKHIGDMINGNKPMHKR